MTGRRFAHARRGLFRCTQKASMAGADIERRFQKELERFEKMRELAESIRDDADKLSEEVRKRCNALDLRLRKAKSTLRALDVQATEAEEAKLAPLMLPAGSLVQARRPRSRKERHPVGPWMARGVCPKCGAEMRDKELGVPWD